MASNDAAAVRRGERRLLIEFFPEWPVHESVERRIENIQNQSAFAGQVTANACETRELIGHGEEMLKGSKQNGGEMNGLWKAEIPHVGLDELHSGSNSRGLTLKPL